MKPLEPVDLQQCQAETRQHTPFRLGGPAITIVRCKNIPFWIATETNADKYGRHGVMSLCPACKFVCEAQVPNIEFKEI